MEDLSTLDFRESRILSNGAIFDPLPQHLVSSSILPRVNTQVGGNNLTGNINPLFCDPANFNTTILERLDSIWRLKFDCAGSKPEIVCDCCTSCGF